MAYSAPSPTRRILIRIFKIGLVLLITGLIALAVAVGVAMQRLPPYADLVKRDDLGQMIRVRAADGTLLVALGPSFGDWLPANQIPQVMKDAIVAVEDRRFRAHPGVDPIGIARGIKDSVSRGGRVTAVSTLSQQLARNIFLTNKRSPIRKIKEGILALALERRFSKEQILELYLNRVYFGGGAYGIDAASRRFFGHSATTLNLSEAAIIAGLVKAPSNYSPTADPNAGKRRAQIVIRLMREQGYISPAAAASAEPAGTPIVPAAPQNSVRYFTDWVLPQLDTLIEETKAPIEVWTTLDPALQRAADAAINANTPAGAQGALVSLDRDGAVRAMVGGRDYVRSLYNRATQAQRQPGSSFKLFVYLAALEAGYRTEDTLVDKPVTINGWSPRNSSRSFAGTVTLRRAFASSINTVSAQLGQELGFSTIADMAQRFGITSKINTQPSMVLGTSEVRLIDMTRAFASVAAKGQAVTPYGILRVARSNGQILYEHRAQQGRTLVAPHVAAQMVDLMQTAVASGTGRAAQIGRPVAGKTGTTSSNKDGWFVGFSSGITTGVWMGRDDNKAVGGLQGGTSPARAFQSFMMRAVANRPVEQFDTQVQLPDWAEEEPDEAAYYNQIGIDEGSQAMQVDADGYPIEPGTSANDPNAPGQHDGDNRPTGRPLPPDLQDLIDRATEEEQDGRRAPPRRSDDEAVERSPMRSEP